MNIRMFINGLSTKAHRHGEFRPHHFRNHDNNKAIDVAHVEAGNLLRRQVAKEQLMLTG